MSIRIGIRERSQAQLPGQVQAGHLRQADVEDDRVEPAVAGDDVERLLAGFGDLDHVPVLEEQPFEHAAQARVVLDDEQVHRSSDSGHATRAAAGPSPL